MTVSFILIFVLLFVDIKISTLGYVISTTSLLTLCFVPELHWIFIGTITKYKKLLNDELEKMKNNLKQ